jgi:small subunit ribosomal protein S20
MANIKSAKKRIKVTEKKTAVNRAQKSQLNTYIKKFRAAPSKDTLATVVSLIDKASQDCIIHSNKADRLKARLSKLVSA